jgi:hypothetical protein
VVVVVATEHFSVRIEYAQSENRTESHQRYFSIRSVGFPPDSKMDLSTVRVP